MESSTYYALGIALLVLGGIWKIFQTQIDSTNKRIEVLEHDIVNRTEHAEFAKRVDGELYSIKKQLSVLETTRPTTGELKAVGDGNKDQITKIEDRVGKLEEHGRLGDKS